MTQTPVVSLSGNDRALFCSDIHLHGAEPLLAEWFLRELKAQAASVSHLFLLGDIFEAWIGDDTADPVSLETLTTLVAIARSGVAVLVMRGNRDFLINENKLHGLNGFDWGEHVQLLEDPAVVQFWNEPILIAHGDLLCSDDKAYQEFRSLRNTPQWRSEFMARPLAVREALTRQMREQSEREKTLKSAYLVDVNQNTLEAGMLAAGVKTLIHGHTHRPAHHQWSLAGQDLQRWVLPDWRLTPRRGGFLKISRMSSSIRYEKLGDWA